MTGLTHALRGRTRYPGLVNPSLSSPAGLLTTQTASGKTTSQNGNFAHTIDVNTSLLVVLWASSTANATSQITSLTAGGTAMTIGAQYGANWQGAGVAYLQNPAAGSLSIAWTCNSGISAAGLYLYAINFISIAATPISLKTADANLSHTHAVVAGNYAVEAIRNANNLSPTDGQTLILQAQSPYYAFAYKLITATGTEALSWSGTQSYAGHASAIISL